MTSKIDYLSCLVSQLEIIVQKIILPPAEHKISLNGENFERIHFLNFFLCIHLYA